MTADWRRRNPLPSPFARGLYYISATSMCVVWLARPFHLPRAFQWYGLASQTSMCGASLCMWSCLYMNSRLYHFVVSWWWGTAWKLWNGFLSCWHWSWWLMVRRHSPPHSHSGATDLCRPVCWWCGLFAKNCGCKHYQASPLHFHCHLDSPWRCHAVGSQYCGPNPHLVLHQAKPCYSEQRLQQRNCKVCIVPS